MAAFGVTSQGFVRKEFATLLAEAVARARSAFGDDVDLSPTSPLLKILQVTAAEDARLWRRLEDLYYSRFLSSAIGDDLDRLGEEVGFDRPHLTAAGEVTITVENPQPGRVYVLPEGTVLVAPGPVAAFHTTATVRLSAGADTATVAARAFAAGPGGDVAAGAVTEVDPDFQRHYLGVAPPTGFRVTNQRPFTGGADHEGDEAYRGRLLGRSRTMWTPAAVREAVLAVPGVVDVLLSDPLGGVDVSQSYFGAFPFDQRLFSDERRLGEPYFFSVVVAHEFARPWRTEPPGTVTGLFEQVTAAIDRVRPVGIHPQVVEADHIEVGLRARLVTQPGYDSQALVGALTERLAADVGGLALGGDVLFSQVMRALVEQPGVSDVQDLRLRRCPPAFGRITLGQVAFAADVVEAGPGESLTMGPTEIAVFTVDSTLLDLEVTPR
ncbi:baseplate J/gp47 family protein [Nonomuraea ferruginea]|uniref:Baseplate J/gp47 family protein n=1 Tax=Nonomuraea ferruginea TaxID=46174 RepID=A0ABT4T0G9_9ACTN|nr:baseplate J/gp47 family protein [Nonomuraea ferruginea]MDA0642810.1 baseplate J/gp47 family protein [Nonomuraea ferruginea]